ncbi:acyl carrier protein [Terriglobus aquaticus]|uniref:Acyl carrier protein n=1 Tax=Terriglobus aquaticus TaxID=940139 RepID=A0ABW9KH01_9BACT|nr:acyl carrier protein [Terriglobus aquaticus]
MTDIEQECIRRIAEAKGLPLHAVHLGTALDAIGVDSLDRVSLSFDLEEQYGIQIPESKLQSIQTVADVATAVQEAMPRTAGAGAKGPGPDGDASVGSA